MRVVIMMISSHVIDRLGGEQYGGLHVGDAFIFFVLSATPLLAQRKTSPAPQHLLPLYEQLAPLAFCDLLQT